MTSTTEEAPKMDQQTPKRKPKMTRKARRRGSQDLLFQLTSWKKTLTRKERRDSKKNRKKYNNLLRRKRIKKMWGFRLSRLSTRRSIRNKEKIRALKELGEEVWLDFQQPEGQQMEIRLTLELKMRLRQ